MAARDMLPVCIVQPPNCSAETACVAAALSQALSTHGLVATAAPWPPSVEDVKDKFVISLLDMDGAFLCKLDARSFEVVRQVALQSRRLLWVCPNNDPQMAVAVGWLRVLQNENVNRTYQHLILEERPEDSSTHDVSLAIARAATAVSGETEFIEQDGSLSIARWTYEPEMTHTVAKSELSFRFDRALLKDAKAASPLQMLHGGNLEYAHFAPDVPRVLHLARDEVEIDLRFIVVADADVKYPGRATHREASGVVKAVGRDVSRLRPADHVCLSFFGRLSTRVVAKEVSCHSIPFGVRLDEGACVPITFATAYRALVDVARMKPGQTVLVQAAGTKLGQAAVLLAKASNAVVYATVRCREEAERLIALGVSPQNLLIQDDPELLAAIRSLTDGRGLDVVLRTTRPEGPQCLLTRCLAPFGAFIDAFSEKEKDPSDELIPQQEHASPSWVLVVWCRKIQC